jgi:hypothetical protein
VVAVDNVQPLSMVVGTVDEPRQCDAALVV